MANEKSDFFKTDWFSAMVVIGIGVFFLIHANSIESFQAALIGPRRVPMLISIMIIGLGTLQFVLSWLDQNREKKTSTDNDFDVDNVEPSAMTKASVLRLVALHAIGFAYIWLFSATGYIISTAFAFALLLVVFGTYNAGKLAMMSIGTSIAYYTIFIWLMGLYVPEGWLVNLKILGF